jgi:hypothetical protein
MRTTKKGESSGKVEDCQKVRWYSGGTQGLAERHGSFASDPATSYRVTLTSASCNRLPGSGMKGAKQFEEGYFTDGLHLGLRGYDVLSNGLLEVLQRWPELEPERIEA